MDVLRTRIATDELDLEAWLDLPSGDGPHPVVVLIHGSGPTDLDVENRYAEIRTGFARAGIACVQWDKPGCGASSGCRRQLERHSSRVAEVRAALDWIRTREDLDSGRIVLWGISEGAWIAAMVARDSEEMIGLILVSTPSSDLKYAAEYIARANLSLEGYQAGEIQMYVDDVRRCLQLAEERASYEHFLTASARLRANNFFQMTGWNRIVLEEWEDEALRENFLTDTKELLLHVRRPLLAVFGGKDSQVDWRRSATAFERISAENKDVNLTIRVFPDADHNLRSCSTGSLRETRSRSGSASYVPGYVEAMLEWLSERL